MTWNRLVPVFEGVVDNGPKQQPVSHLRRSSKGEHVNGSQGGVSLTQATAERERHCEVKAILVFPRLVLCKSISSKCKHYCKFHVLTNSQGFPWEKNFSFNKFSFFFRSHYFHFGERGYPYIICY